METRTGTGTLIDSRRQVRPNSANCSEKLVQKVAGNGRTGAGEKLELREAEPRTQLPLAAKQLRIMGNHTSLGTKTVLVALQLVLLINNWTFYGPEIRDQIDVKVWDSATKNDQVAVGLLGTWQAVSEALKSRVEPQSQTCGLPDSEGAAGSCTDPTATPWAPLLPQPSKAFAVTPSPIDLDVPFDPGLIGLEKEMDMLFLDPGRTGYIRPED